MLETAKRVSLLPKPGDIVRVRQRRYLCEGVEASESEGDCSVVRLACVDDDNQGQLLEVFWEHEIDKQVLTAENWDQIASRGFDERELFAAYLKTLQWNCVTATDPNLFQSPFRAGIRIDAYQLEPLEKALKLPRVNLFIADDVGLGKTIEAGLIARELLLRKKVREIVVSCPPSMIFQWKEELEYRFGLTFEIIDRDYVKRVRQESGFGVNPWTTHSRFLISHKLLIDEAYVGPLRDWLGTKRSGSLLILDEAHHAAPSSGARYAIDSKITRAVRELAARFEHRLFLSATPHNGHSNSFSSLLEILDPQRFCRGVPVAPKLRDEVLVRRLKSDVREVIGGFPRRIVEQVNIDGLPEESPELLLMNLLDKYRELREERLQSESKRVRTNSGLLIIGLQQRLLSSIEAFAKTLRVHRRTVEKQFVELAERVDREESISQVSQLDLSFEPVDPEDDRAVLPENEIEVEEEAICESVSRETFGDIRSDRAGKLFAQERVLLEQMEELADSARNIPDAKVKSLLEWIRKSGCPNLGQSGAKWEKRRVIIFTEWEDTLRYLKRQLENAIVGSDLAESRIRVYRGSTSARKREEIKRSFNADPSEDPVRILLATDAAREGLNLQTHCFDLFHFDVPWNPSRLEQRNGRIDRKLQPNDVVYCRYFFYRQRPEDAILKKLVEKTETIKEELGSLSQVIDKKVKASFDDGIRRRTITAHEKQIETADLDIEHRQMIAEELESARRRQDELRKQIEFLNKRLDQARKYIGLDKDHFRSAISCALRLNRAEPLVEITNDRGLAEYRFPAIDMKDGADPTWAHTLDALRIPRTADQKFFQWRKESPIRPIVFDDPGTMDEKVVHLHLEHRVVQRLLGRFVSQGFVHNDLSRACLAQSDDSVARVLLIGRLCLYGPNAARLHEQLLHVTSRWIEPEKRKDGLSPYAEDAQRKTLELLERSLIGSHGFHVDDTDREMLLANAQQDIQELLPHLEEEGRRSAQVAVEKLKRRAEAEAMQMKEILETQKKHIEKTISKHAHVDQLQLKLESDEFQQLLRNRKFWPERLSRIEEELSSEPARIKDLYEIQATRIEPVGLVYLYPVKE